MVENWEREALKSYVKEKGLDIGCGKFKIGEMGVDNDEKVKPDILAEMDKIPLADNSLNYIVSCHSLEHHAETIKVLTEWHRLLKKGGLCAVFVPDGMQTSSSDLGDSEFKHKQIFSKESLRMFFEFCGFKINELARIGRALFLVGSK